MDNRKELDSVTSNNIIQNLENPVDFNGTMVLEYETIALKELEDQLYIPYLEGYKFFSINSEIEDIPGKGDFGPQEYSSPPNWHNTLISVKNNRTECIYIYHPNYCDACFAHRNCNWEPSSEGCENCTIKKIPESLSLLQNLRQLFIIGRPHERHTYLPKNMNPMPSLETLAISGLWLVHLSDFLCSLKSLRTLNLTEDDLDKIPKGVYKLNYLKNLILRRNRIKLIPDTLTKIKTLQYIDLSENKLKDLPDTITDLKELNTLNLSHNKFSFFPESICDIKSLQKIYLRGNKLTSIPESIVRLKSLKKLDLSYNKLETLPETIGKIKSLQKLVLTENKIEKLPDFLRIWEEEDKNKDQKNKRILR